MVDEVFHEGEIEVQERSGRREAAARLGPRMIAPALDAGFAPFLREQTLVIAASRDSLGRVWASPLTGARGFVVSLADGRILLRTVPAPDDPLLDALARDGTQVGLLVLDSMTRSRIRINGKARRVGAAIELTVDEAFGNCPKYIQRRQSAALVSDGQLGARVVRSGFLAPHQRALVQAADTFFIATAHAARGADASHRGGRPGFAVVSDDGARLTFPDYRGNNMFQTLGNLTVDAAVGLLFIDWDRRTTLQISGYGTVIWDPERIAVWPGAQRLVDVEIEAVLERRAGVPVRWELVEADRLNPDVPPGANA